MKCLICHSEDIALKYKTTLSLNKRIKEYSVTHSELGVHLDIWECSKCRLAFVSDSFAITELINTYQQNRDDNLYKEEIVGRIKSAHKILKKIKKIKPAGHLLDIGCGTGIFITEASRLGYDVWGIEPSPAIKNVALNQDHIINNYLENVYKQIPDDFYDIITMFDVLEHLPNPNLTLDIIYNKLKTDGILIIATPNWSSWLAKITKEKWYAIQPHHLYYYSRKNLFSLLHQHQFKTVSCDSYKRYFSLSYIITRLSAYNRVFKLIDHIIPGGLKNKIIIPINFHDELLITVIK